MIAEQTETDAESAERDTFTFRAALLPEFEYRLGALQKTARKLGVPPITFEEIGREIREEMTYTVLDDGQIREYLPAGTARIEYVTIRTHGESPVLPGGWTFLGAIDHTDGGNILHGDAPELAQYRTASADCVHCGTKRNRRKTIVCRSESGELAQIGSACVKDFLGYHGNPERLLALCELVRELREMEDESYRGGEGYEIGTPTDLFLSAVCACVRVHGWTPRSATEYGGICTADLVRYVLGDERLTKYDTEELKAMVAAVRVTDEDATEAQSVKDFALSIPADTPNNYLGNVRVSLAGSYVLSRHYGIAASAVSARRTDEERAREKAEREGKRVSSRHFGTIGERVTLRVTVDFVRSFFTDFGTKYLVTMSTDSGDIVKTFNTGNFGRSAERGDVLTIKGTVKEHEDYKGTLSTMLTRVSIVETHTEQKDA